MKQLILILVALIIVFYGCNHLTLETSNSIASVNSNTSSNIDEETGGGQDGDFSDCTCPPGERWRHEVSYTYIKYVGTEEHKKFSENYAKEVHNGKKSYCNYFVEFLKYFKLTPDEFLTVIEMENKRMIEIGEPIEYNEAGVKDILKTLYGDENIVLKKPVDMLLKQSGSYGKIFGDTEVADAKDIKNPLYYSIPLRLQAYVGVRQLNQWAAGLEKREDYNIVNFVKYFDIPEDEFDMAFEEMNYNTQFNHATGGETVLLSQEAYDSIRRELYGETKTLSEVSLPDAVYQKSSVASSLPWNTPEEKSAYYAASEALMAQSQTSSKVSSTVTNH